MRQMWRPVVERITPYGAFLKLEDGRLGLVHISEIDRNYVKDVHEHLREQDVVQAKVLAIKEDGKIDLSIKALQDPPPERRPPRRAGPGETTRTTYSGKPNSPLQRVSNEGPAPYRVRA